MSFAGDKAYGRGGGRFGRHPKADETLRELHRVRLAAIKRNGTNKEGEPEWPQASIDAWRVIARRARSYPDGTRLSDTEQRAIEIDDAARKVGR